MIDVGVLGAQNVVNHAVAPAPTGVGGFNDFALQLYIERAGLAVMAVAVAA